MKTLELRASLMQEIVGLLDNDEAMEKLQKYIRRLKKEITVNAPAVQPYTMAELNERINQAEDDVRTGRTLSNEQMFEEIDNYLKELCR
ncbi:MAG: hypothetical protein LUH63_10830 [Parabacteroides sp.]|nr:hypothetical protein [Parabacteroides sp.]